MRFDPKLCVLIPWTFACRPAVSDEGSADVTTHDDDSGGSTTGGGSSSDESSGTWIDPCGFAGCDTSSSSSSSGEPEVCQDAEESPALPLGTVAELMESCEPGRIAGTECRRLEVACPELPPVRVSVLISRPERTPVGTIVFGTGGEGMALYEGLMDGPARELLEDLRDDGFVIVQRQWDPPTGWVGGEGGLTAAACRYATLLDWVERDLVDPGTAFCATGNSGGATEIAYAIARYGFGQRLDLALLTSGPPWTEVDKGCLLEDAWLSECLELRPPGSECTADRSRCDYGEAASGWTDDAYPGTPCASADASFTEAWANDSLTAEDAEHCYVRAFVHSMFGADDCGIAPPQGMLFYDAVLSPKALDVVAGSPHGMNDDPEGAAAIADALRSECVAQGS